jgi:hypothetical protein
VRHRLCGHEALRELRIHDSQATTNGGERGMDTGPDLIAKHDATRTGREGRGDMGLIANDRDGRHRKRAQLAEAAQSFLCVDPGIP